MKEITLDGSFMTSVEETHKYLKSKLNLPSYYGSNLDALWDVLSTISEPTKINLINSSQLSTNLGEYGNALLNVFQDASHENDKIIFVLYNKLRKDLKMGNLITRDEAWILLNEYNKEEFHLQHAKTVESVMRYFAKKLGFENEVEFWGLVGLLHDLDFEMYPQEHCVKVQEILREKGLDERLIHAIASHGHSLTKADAKPEHMMEKVLFTIDELTGLIGAVALMRPSKSVSDLEVKSLKKKFKTPSFAAGCSRDAIQKGAEMLGWDLDYLFQETILAMREMESAEQN
jgi:predicted hydrolase (HD superfamily)